MSKSQGFTILEILLTLVIVSVIAYTLTTYISSMQSQSMRLQLSDDILTIKDSLYKAVDCTNTLSPFEDVNGNVHCSGAIVLRDRNNAQVNLNYANWKLRVSCTDKQILVYARSVNRQGLVNNHPIYKNEKLDFTNTRINPIFGPGSSTQLCLSYLEQGGRVKKKSVRLAALPSPGPFSAADCNRVSSEQIEPLGGQNSPQWPLYIQAFRLYERMRASCSNYCNSAPIYARSGYLVDCNPSNARGTCVCFR